jgi:thiol-disulfide isomerase/thioredoxin
MKSIRAVPLMLAPLILAAQTVGTLNLYPSNPAAEQSDLTQALREANGSGVDLTRALEDHLKKYPNSSRRPEIEASLYKTALAADDSARIAMYGKRLLARKPEDLDMLDRVIRALLAAGDEESSKEALEWTARYEAAVQNLRARTPEGHTTKAQWTDLADRAFARELVLKARATGNLGNAQEAVKLATQAWTLQPGAENAAEIGKWSAKLGRNAEAIQHYAEAATIEDERAPWSERHQYRERAGKLYARLHGSEQGLGDVFLRAWDRGVKALANRSARYKAMDSNYGASTIYEFTLPGGGNNPVGAENLDLAQLKGKTVVMDFWATWCQPCIAQHPMIERVKQKYAGAADVEFLSLDADDNHALVAPFLTAHKWMQPVYLEAGLAGLLKVTSLPTILVIDPNGEIFSRMTGFSADVFERMLTTRVDGARALAPQPK